jgi:4a-hydroxytetrahydrobiopterin dehydratase
MTDRISAQQFSAADGVADWRVLFSSACTLFRTRSFATGVALVDEVGRLADAANHHPDVDLRYTSVTVRLRSHDVDGLSRRDVELARRISQAARELGVAADPSAVESAGLVVDALGAALLPPFWRAVLGEADASRPQRGRLHVSVPPAEAEARIAAALAAGGRLVSDADAPQWWTLADPEGTEVDVATETGRD